MAYLYLLKNRINRYYVGITNINPEDRLRRHNQGDVFSTRFNRPWQLLYVESYSTMAEARKR